MKVRVINKNKQGVTFKILDLPKKYGQPRQEASWAEFDANFKQVEGEKFIYESNEKFNKEQEDKIQLFTQLFPHMLKLRAQQKDGGIGNLTDVMVLSSFQEEYHKKFGGAPIDFIREYREFERVMLEQFMMDGIGVGKVHRQAHNFREDKWTPEEKEKVRQANEKADKEIYTHTIGDLLEAKKDASE